MSRTQVFISWSGDRSRELAEFLRKWMPRVMQHVHVWVSTEDIEKGAPWLTKLFGELKETQFGIACVASESVSKPWLIFECGAIANALVETETHVCPYLLDVPKEQLAGPLAALNAADATKDDTLRLLRTINRVSGDAALDKDILEHTFENEWPDLERTINALRDRKKITGHFETPLPT